MLATEVSRYPAAGSSMASSYQSRTQMNGHFGSSGSVSGPSRSGTGLSQNDFAAPQRVGSTTTISSAGGQSLAPNQSIINIRAPPDSSLFQICRNLKRRLAQVPGFEEHILEMEEEEQDANDATDPVTMMWNCLRRGFPLLTLYNAFRPAVRLQVDPNIPENKVTKHAAFKFLQACMANLKFAPSEMFLITDLYGENTTGFVKVTKVVNRVLDLLAERGFLMERTRSAIDPDAAPPLTQTVRQKIITELIDTERDYINHLENLQQFKNELEQSGAITGDVIHSIFLNLDGILEFQRRFQVRLEQQYNSPEDGQQWGKLFWHYAEPFEVYVPFIANQENSTKTVAREWEKLQSVPISAELHGIVETQSILLSFLSKPFQRLTKYPMLLDQMERKGGYSPDLQSDLRDGAERARSILHKANDAIAKEGRKQAVEELAQRVEDWKGHKIDHFGDLLLNGTYTVLKGEGTKEVEREYKVYLFERILLCCKEINPNKSKNKMLGNSRPLVDKKGKLKLQLKGRIFMQNVTDVLTVSKSERSSFTIQIFWKGDPGVENFVIRFPDESTMTSWRETVQRQKTRLSEARTSGPGSHTSSNFPWMKSQPAVPNPYQEDDVDDTDVHPGRSVFPVSRNTSNTSLQSYPRPAVGNGSRSTHPKLSAEHNGAFVPPLSVNTNIPTGTQSPGDFAGSYFSPTNESPVSTRVHSQQNMFGFPRQGTPTSGWSQETNKHRTAPAAPRAPSREGYARPSLPPMATSQSIMHHMQQVPGPPSRNRSASHPNIPGSMDPQGRKPMDNVPVPPIPHGMQSNLNRTTSPIGGQLPVRSAPNPAASYDSRGQRMPAANDYPTSRPMQSYGGAPTRVDQTPTSSNGDDDFPYPSQIKTKVWYDGSKHYVTIVVGSNIKYRTLADRIDSKMVKICSQAISKGTAKLVYEDAEGDVVTIDSDEDVAMAFEDWFTRHVQQLREKNGLIDDFELMWQERNPG